MKPRIAALVCLALFVTGIAPRAVDAAQKDPIRVDAAKAEATEKGEITGQEFVDYVFAAQVGQSLSIVLAASSKNAHFDLIGPGTETPIYISAITGDRYQANVRADGDHLVRVYLVRRAARKGESASYTITFRLSAAAP